MHSQRPMRRGFGRQRYERWRVRWEFREPNGKRWTGEEHVFAVSEGAAMKQVAHVVWRNLFSEYPKRVKVMEVEVM